MSLILQIYQENDQSLIDLYIYLATTKFDLKYLYFYSFIITNSYLFNIMKYEIQT